jgi:hypothetical protein
MVWIELVCDWCQDVFTHGVGRRELRRYAKEHGWAFAWSEDHGHKIDICARCIKAASTATPSPAANPEGGEGGGR